jgi:2-dehydro-3-deoxy-D-gluconate 5-dehydrogenase
MTSPPAESQDPARSVLITGAGRGLGTAIATVLAAEGTRVALGVRDIERGRAVAQDLSDLGAEVIAVELDVTETASVIAAVDEVNQQFGTLDGLVNNAGIIDRRPSLDTTRKQFDHVLQTNIVGAFEVSIAVARIWQSQKTRGVIVNISSVLQEAGGVNVASYAASKGALKQLTRALAGEWALQGIRVNSIAAGYFSTDLTAPLDADPQRRHALLARIPTGRFGDPIEIAHPVSFLLSDRASYITGASLEVDGGWTAG